MRDLFRAGTGELHADDALAPPGRNREAKGFPAPLPGRRQRDSQPRPRLRDYRYHPATGVHVYYPPHGLRPSDQLFVTEGEFKSICLAANGFSVVGLSNFTCYKRDKTGERRLLPGIRTALEKTRAREAFFIGDSDTATNFEFSRSAHFLGKGGCR